MVAYCSMQALPHDMIGVALRHTDSLVAPYGAAKAYPGSNPISVAIPAGQQDPVVPDTFLALPRLAGLIR